MKHNITIIISILLIIALFASLPLVGFANDNRIESTMVEAKSIDMVSPDPSEILPLKENQQKITYTSDELSFSVNKNTVSELQVTTKPIDNEQSKKINITLPIKDTAETNVIDNRIVANDKSNNYLVTSEVGKGEVKTHFVIKDPSAPEQYTMEYELPKGAFLRFASPNNEQDGSIEIIDKFDEPIGAISIPWAKDSKGKNVKTFYKISGNKVIQIVEHKNSDVAYPIVAEPKNKFSDWFKSAKWKSRTSGVYLCVVPTAWNRQSGIAYASTSWSYLKKKMSGTKKWRNEGGLKDQYYCHTQLAKLKSSWNLEPWRPNVSLAKTLASGCNPK